jgi:hypothetical protein
VSLRIGERIDLPKDDAHHRLNQLADSKFNEEESSAGPVYFGPRIRSEPILAKFMLPRDMPKYTGAVKPEDWLSDYVTTVDIAGGNKRTVMRYAPLMLTSAQTWLNSLPALQINSWHDFKEAFIKNFTGTYKRPPRPRQLADCYRWRGGDEVNDRPVGKPQEEGMMNIATSFSLSKKPRFNRPVGKSQTQEGDAC